MIVIPDTRIAITGTGICTPIGNTSEEVVESLIAGRSGIAPFHGDGTERMVSQLASIHHRFQLDDRFPASAKVLWDRATQMAAMAATDAVDRSGILTSHTSRNRIGMAVGVSGAGQFSPERNFQLTPHSLNEEIAELLLRRNVPQYQLYQIARALNIAGPMTCICSASAGSGIAIGNAMRWLLAEQADAVVAGGSEAVMLLNFLGFDTLGLLSPKPCSPFSGCEGMTMGEGAAYVVLERHSDAVARQADIRGVLLGFGVSSDAFDPILYDPTGDGIHRAMQSAIGDAQLNPKDIDWIRTSGAGGKEQDTSEIMAIRALFQDSMPLVTSTEANFGHCNGAGPAIGLVSAIETQRQGWIPPTLNYDTISFPGIDFVPNKARKEETNHFLSTTAAFGGSNVVLVGGTSKTRSPVRHFDEVVISGIGVVTNFGCADSHFIDRIGERASFIGKLDRKGLEGSPVEQASLVREFSFRREVPSIPSRGVDLLTQYATAATKYALQEAESSGGKIESNRLGIVTGVGYTSTSLLEKFFSEIQGLWATPTVGRTLLNKGRFLVTSRLANWFGCKNYNATHSGGIGCGQVALNQAYEQLRQSPDMDAVVVVAADEVSRLQMILGTKLGWLARDNGSMLPYDSKSEGMILGEGAVAFVLERKSSVAKRGGKALASITGAASSLDMLDLESKKVQSSAATLQLSQEGTELQLALQAAIDQRRGRDSDLNNSIDMVLGNAYGIASIDARELSVVNRTFSNQIPFGSLAATTGVMQSCGSLFNLAFSVAAMNDPKACRFLNSFVLLPDRSRLDASPRNVALMATSEDGHNVATIVSRLAKL